MRPDPIMPGQFTFSAFTNPHSKRFRITIVIAALVTMAIIWLNYSYVVSKTPQYSARRKPAAYANRWGIQSNWQQYGRQNIRNFGESKNELDRIMEKQESEDDNVTPTPNDSEIDELNEDTNPAQEIQRIMEFPNAANDFRIRRLLRFNPLQHRSDSNHDKQLPSVSNGNADLAGPVALWSLEPSMQQQGKKYLKYQVESKIELNKGSDEDVDVAQKNSQNDEQDDANKKNQLSLVASNTVKDYQMKRPSSNTPTDNSYAAIADRQNFVRHQQHSHDSGHDNQRPSIPNVQIDSAMHDNLWGIQTSRQLQSKKNFGKYAESKTKLNKIMQEESEDDDDALKNSRNQILGDSNQENKRPGTALHLHLIKDTQIKRPSFNTTDSNENAVRAARQNFVRHQQNSHDSGQDNQRPSIPNAQIDSAAYDNSRGIQTTRQLQGQNNLGNYAESKIKLNKIMQEESENDDATLKDLRNQILDDSNQENERPGTVLHSIQDNQMKRPSFNTTEGNENAAGADRRNIYQHQQRYDTRHEKLLDRQNLRKFAESKNELNRLMDKESDDDNAALNNSQNDKLVDTYRESPRPVAAPNRGRDFQIKPPSFNIPEDTSITAIPLKEDRSDHFNQRPSISKAQIESVGYVKSWSIQPTRQEQSKKNWEKDAESKIELNKIIQDTKMIQKASENAQSTATSNDSQDNVLHDSNQMNQRLVTGSNTANDSQMKRPSFNTTVDNQDAAAAR